jgi:hypothetical protein
VRATRALARGDWWQAPDLVGKLAALRNTVQGSAVRLWLPESWQTLIDIAATRLDEAFTLIDAGMQAAQRYGISANIRVWSMLRFVRYFAPASSLTLAPRPRRRSKWRTR